MQISPSSPATNRLRSDRKRREQRPRVLFSCTSCRNHKLKCDRKTPCSNCVRRSQPSCNYIKHRNRITAWNGHTDGLLLPGGEGGTRYINHTHWRALMSSLSDRLLTRGTYPRNEDALSENNAQGPDLLLGLPETASLPELLSGLPDRHTADVLINRYLDSREISLVFLHIPTFRNQYIDFWENQAKVSLPWLAFLYGVLSCAAWNDSMTNRESPIAPASLPDMISFYRRQCALCLKCSNYTVPGEFKVEALVQYLGIEYLQRGNLKTGISVLLSMVVRLAILMGYHRDSQPYPHISVFEAEMRRRLWLFLRITDTIISWQTGLPRVISGSQADTSLPRNLLDNDFGPSTTILPPSRSEHHSPTIVAYMLAQNRLLSVSSAIMDASSLALLSDAQVASYNCQLNTARDCIPTPFRLYPRMSHTPTSLTTDTEVLDCNLSLQRYNLEITYQRARIILHRPYLLLHISQHAYSLSRQACVDAATRILQYQSDIFRGVLRAATNHYQVWFGASISICDCLTASMVISLEVIYRLREGGKFESRHGCDDLLGLLEKSYETWRRSPRRSVEIDRAAETTGVMLSLINEHKSGQIRPSVGNARDDTASPLQSVDSDVGEPAFELFDWDRWDQEMQQLHGSLTEFLPPDPRDKFMQKVHY